MSKKNSFVTVTDQFCGAGGSSLGAVAAGAEVVMALNHWRLAIETHSTNFPNTAHDCTDISACDPRRYPSTDILITSPECTNHSLAKGKKRPLYHKDLFGNVLIDPAEERSRATMWDVPRFAEYHGYNIIIVENVVDARQWVMYDAWLHAMDSLGYAWREVYLNSMFTHPTPQSRDRLYVVFWKKGNRAPNLDITPLALCTNCAKNVNGVQTWKRPDRRFGRYGAHGQYIYTCPECTREVAPYYYPALSAIDWSLPIQRIGDRARPLTARTLERVRRGLERFKGQHLVVDILYSHGHNDRSRPVAAPWPTQVAQQQHALVGQPWLMQVNQSGERARLVTDPLPTQTASLVNALIEPAPFLVEAHGTSDVRPITGPLGAVLAGGNHHYLAMPFLQPMTRDDQARSVAEPGRTQTGTEAQALVMPLLIRNYGERGGNLAWPVTDSTGTITGVDHHSLCMPFVASYYGNDTLHTVAEAMGTVTSKDHHALVAPLPFITSKYTGPNRNPNRDVTRELPTAPGMQVHQLVCPDEDYEVEDCGLRMLKPHEIGAAMAFPSWYKVLGNQREQVKQYGNAVTPPSMDLLIERCVGTLA